MRDSAVNLGVEEKNRRLYFSVFTSMLLILNFLFSNVFSSYIVNVVHTHYILFDYYEIKIA